MLTNTSTRLHIEQPPCRCRLSMGTVMPWPWPSRRIQQVLLGSGSRARSVPALIQSGLMDDRDLQINHRYHTLSTFALYGSACSCRRSYLHCPTTFRPRPTTALPTPPIFGIFTRKLPTSSATLPQPYILFVQDQLSILLQQHHPWSFPCICHEIKYETIRIEFRIRLSILVWSRVFRLRASHTRYQGL